MNIIILLGPPASGKGTQSLILSKLLDIHHISIGDIFRKNYKNKTKLGLLVNNFIKKGLLVTDDITNSMISDFLTQEKINKGIILDGYPRNINQGRFLTEELQKKNVNLTKVFYFNVAEKLLEKRIMGRMICPQCGEIYHKETKLPQKHGFCDNDNNALIQRQDDNIDVFNQRLLVYKKETLPLVEYYKQMNKIFEIKVDDTHKSIQDITAIMLKELQK
ncbi:adenylate kinase family protein ['Camptotheca acuminata' phytoplasma]|uniref:adenylate kinase family protein n=1 Tax='Camptotheca acuminata' phytoplasma TaxID=3239192 RepID=UPI003519F290